MRRRVGWSGWLTRLVLVVLALASGAAVDAQAGIGTPPGPSGAGCRALAPAPAARPGEAARAARSVRRRSAVACATLDARPWPALSPVEAAYGYALRYDTATRVAPTTFGLYRAMRLLEQGSDGSRAPPMAIRLVPRAGFAAEGAAGSGGRWAASEFRGTRVYQRDDLIDPAATDALGRTSLERMAAGRAPIGPDGNPINLHHMIQADDGPIAEVTQSFHQQYSSVLHINPSSIASGIDRGAFGTWRSAYWIARAKGF